MSINAGERWYAFTSRELQVMAIGLQSLNTGEAAELMGQIAWAIATHPENEALPPVKQ
jgi:hypothetical protein